MDQIRKWKPVCVSAAIALLASMASHVIVLAGDTPCTGSLGTVSVNNLRVNPNGECTLNGTIVNGNIYVGANAKLHASSVQVTGNIQANSAASVNVYAGSFVGGNLEVIRSGEANIQSVEIKNNLLLNENSLLQNAANNSIGGNLQAYKNIGGVTINGNTIDGNLQCQDNSPPPTGSGNTVNGNLEDQCIGFDAAPQLVANEDAYTLTEDQISVAAPGILENDLITVQDIVEVTLVTPPQFGVVSLGQQGDFVYQVLGGYLGEDTFVYSLKSTGIESNTASVHLFMVDQEAPTVLWIGPVPAGERYDVREGEQIDLEVEAGDNRGISQVNFLRWDAMNAQYVTLGNLIQAPFRLAISADDLNPAWNQVFVKAIDLAGNNSDSPYIWIYKIVEGQAEHKIYLPVAGK